MKRKVIALFLVCALMFGAFTLRAPEAEAVAGVITVLGDMVWTLSSAAEALSLAAAQAGLRDAINSAAAAKGMNFREFMVDLANQYAQLRFRNLGTFLQLFNDGVGYLPTGAITFRGDISSVISDFLDWSHDPDGGNLEEYVTPSADSDLTVNDPSLSIPSFPLTSYAKFSTGGEIYANSDKLALFKSGKNVTAIVASNTSPLTYSTTRSWNNSYTYSYTENGNTVYYRWIWFEFGYPYNGTISEGAFYDGSRPDENVAKYYAYAMVYGAVSGDNDIDLGVWDLPDGGLNDINILDPNDAMEYPADFGGGSISIGGWFGGVADTIFTGSASMDFTDANSESQTTTVDRAMVDGKEAEMDLTKSAAESVDDTLAGSGTIADDVGEYSLDLRDYFPFCIPFDIYDMLSLLTASPVAPHFDYRFYLPGLVDQTIEIDLSAFDTVATVLRTMELIAFAVALAAGTKKLLFGS